MRIISDLELILCGELTKGIMLFQRKNNSSVNFIVHSYVKLDNIREAYYVTRIDNNTIDKFKNCEITFKDILLSAKVIFYVISNINSRESISTNKINIADIEFTDIMCSNISFDKRNVEDACLDINDIDISCDETEDLLISEKFEYLIDMDIDDDNRLLHDDMVYLNDETEDEDSDDIYSSDTEEDDII